MYKTLAASISIKWTAQLGQQIVPYIRERPPSAEKGIMVYEVSGDGGQVMNSGETSYTIPILYDAAAEKSPGLILDKCLLPKLV